MHPITVKEIVSSKGVMNLYRGCTHGCIYCDARSKCYHMDHAFEDIAVKENAIMRLEYTLKHKRKKCMIMMGSMSDPYIPLERELGHVRSALSLIARYGFGVTLTTKSDLVLRDIDILREINEKTKCVVQMTLTTYDDALCRKIEPHVCVTSERFKVLKTLRDAGIPTVVWLMPILPFINDTEANISGIADMCVEAKVYGIICMGMGVTLREGNREYFYQQLDRLFPHMKETYQRTYGNQYFALSPNHHHLMNVLHQKCNTYGIQCNYKEVFAYLSTWEKKEIIAQQCLWDRAFE